MDLEIRHLRLVSAVAEHQSLTKAGDVLHLSQSALSHQLRDIEDRLGARLFHRLNKRMLLTPAGERLLESAHAVLSELTNAEVAIRSGLGQRPASLRLSTECYTCYQWLPPVLKPFRQRFPLVHVSIDPTATTDPIGRLLAGELDLAIVSSPIKHARLADRPLFDEEHVLLLPADHRLTKRPYARLADFKDERLLTYSGGADSHFVTRVLRPSGIVPSHVEQVALIEAAIEMVRAGLGVAVLSRWAVAPHLGRGSLAAMRITADGYSRHWRAVMHRHLAEADYVSEFLRLVVTAAPPVTGPDVVPFPGPRGRRHRLAAFAASR